MTEPDDLIPRLAAMLPEVPAEPAALQRIREGIRRRRRARWGASGALVTAAVVTLAVVATSGGSDHRDSIVSPIAPASPSLPTAQPTAPASSAAATSAPSNPATPSDPIVPATPQAENVFVDASGGISLRSAVTDQITRVLVPEPPKTGTHDYYVGVTLGPSGRYVYAFRGTGNFTGFDDAFAIEPAQLDLVRLPVDGGAVEKLRSTALLAGKNAYYYPFQVYPSPDDRSVAVMVSTESPNGHQAPPVLVLLSVPGGTRRDMPTHDSIVGWLPDGHTLVTYNAPDPNTWPADPNPPIVLSTLDVKTGVSKPLANLGVNPPIPTPACGSSISMAVSPVTGEVAVAREAVHLASSGTNCATNLPSTITVTYVEPGTGAVRAGPTLPPAFLSIGDGHGITYTPTGVVLVQPRSSECSVASPVLRIDGAGAHVIDPGRTTC